MQEIMNKIIGYIIQYGISLIGALAIFLVGRWLAHILAQAIENAMLKAKVEKTLTSFSKNMIFIGFMVFVVIAALGQLGIQTTSFVAVIGAAGLAVGLALQGSLSNFAGGVMLILFRPFKAGDTIEAGGATGVVEEIQIFSTIINGADNRRIIVPNSKITGDKITVIDTTRRT